MNQKERIYPQMSAAIFVIIIFWVAAGILFGFGIVRPSQKSVNLMSFFSYFGEAPVVVGTCVLLVIIPRSRHTVVLPVCSVVIVSSAIYIVLKILFSSEPQSLLQLLSGSNYGFPSGHAINNAALYAMLMIQTFIYCKKLFGKILLSLLFMSLAMMVGISRIVLGIHHSGDVLAGWLIGFIVAFLVFFLLNAFLSRQNNAGLNR